MSNLNGNSNGHHLNGASNALVHLNGNGQRPSDIAIEEHNILWDGLPPVVTKALSQPIDLGIVSQRRGRAGMVYHYLEGHTVIDQANRIFGHGGWGYELVGDVTLRRFETVDPRTGEVKKSSGYSAPVRVTVAGAPSRIDVGFHAVAEENPDGHDTALKAAVTDGLKRAFRSFGGQFGNDFYADDFDPASAYQPEQVKPQAVPEDKTESPKPNPRNDSQVEMLRKRLLELGVAQGFKEEQVREAVKARTGRALDALEASGLAPLVKAAANKLNSMRQAKES